MDYKFWIPQGIGVATLAVMIWAALPQQIPADPATGARAPVPNSPLWPYVPIVIMTGLVITNGILLAKQKRQGKGPFLRGQLISGNGSGPQANLQKVNGAALRDFRKDYNVAVVVGLTDNQIDKHEDTRIATSAAFTITKGEIEILIQHSPQMIEAQGQAIAQAIEADNKARAVPPGFRTPPKKKKKESLTRLINYEIKTWTDIVLLPKNVDPKSIQKLSDVPRLNGKIIREELEEGRIKPSVE